MEGTIAEIRLFAGNFAPRNWAFCQGQTISISQNTALFSLLGTNYGGNGQTTFQLPNLAGRTAVGTGTGPGLSNIPLGQMAGTETVTLSAAQMPAHTHTLNANSNTGTTGNPNGAILAAAANTYISGAPNVTMSPQAVGVSGNSQPVPIRNPYLGMNYIICMYGIFPSRP
jgi:microcystin-dependent protein